jgi:hypothetical protein
MRTIILLAAFCLTVMTAWAAGLAGPGPSHGIDYPAGWQDWAAISVAHRTDNDTIRLIVGNDAAVKAARAGQTNPWPDGAVLGKVVWKAVDLDAWPEAKVPGDLVHAEFMFKDSKKMRVQCGKDFGFRPVMLTSKHQDGGPTPLNDDFKSTYAFVTTPFSDRNPVPAQQAR